MNLGGASRVLCPLLSYLHIYIYILNIIFACILGRWLRFIIADNASNELSVSYTMSFCVHVFQWWVFQSHWWNSIAKFIQWNFMHILWIIHIRFGDFTMGVLELQTSFADAQGSFCRHHHAFLTEPGCCRWDKVVFIRLLLQMSCIYVDAHIYIYICFI